MEASLLETWAGSTGWYLSGKTFTTDTPELVFYFDPTSDISKLNTLGNKLDACMVRQDNSSPML